MIRLEDLIVHKKLSVKNIDVQPKKVSAEYCIETFEDKSISTEFIYSYAHPYFDKNDPADVNLASMMLAQVAINYGLFFKEVEFDGLFDVIDRKFIERMIENTSIEILVNKLLMDNVFLKPPFNSLQAEKRNKYSAATINFINTRFSSFKLKKSDAKADKNKYAILSSGGKESLLTYGILKELGEPFPIFVNEAGRHWFTAFNAYHYLAKVDNKTEKAWTNSDRVFNWFVKNLPFIQENYSNIRADIYPLRLWTVAIFVFGVLPVARKRGIGNIVVGDEYDTTVRGVYKGMNHYKGLYDQSRFFDNFLSGYYNKKGWNIKQFSVLRSMSEMLELKLLAERYPELQRHQVSCHAAHSKNNRMYPCGKCEKCRRIIGMLKALDQNPERCGYTPDQIREGLYALGRHSTHQLKSDAAHLYAMLVRKNLIENNDFTKKMAKPHPEIMKLRFDKERSKVTDIPLHLRKALFDILLRYAGGAVKREKGRWVDFELTETFLNEA